MAWSTPLTAAANASLTAVQWNASVRDNLNETGPAKATAGGRLLVTTAANTIAEREVVTAFVGTAESSASTTYVDLTTPGPAATVTTGTKALVSVGCYVSTNPAGRGWMSHAISGATTTGAGDAYASLFTSSLAADLVGASYLALWTTLTAGSNTFTAKYHVTTGTTTGTWQQRRLIVMAL